MIAMPWQDEEMEIRRMHELVEQTTQVLQQAEPPRDADDVPTYSWWMNSGGSRSPMG